MLRFQVPLLCSEFGRNVGRAVLVATLSFVVVPLAYMSVVSAQSAVFSPSLGAVGQQIHVVRSGDTLFGVARLYGADPRSVAAANGLNSSNLIYVGQQLIIPGASSGIFIPSLQQPVVPTLAPAAPSNGVFDPYAASGINVQQPASQPLLPSLPAPTISAVQPLIQPQIGNAFEAAGRKVMHVVRPGDTLGNISSRYGVPARNIIEENRLSVPIQIYVDQALFIPGVGANANSQIASRPIVAQPLAPLAPLTQPSLTPVTPAASIPSLVDRAQQPVVALPVPLDGTNQVVQPTTTTILQPIPPKPGVKPKLVTTVVAAAPSPIPAPIPAPTAVMTPEPVVVPKPVINDTKPVTPTASSQNNDSALADPPPNREKRFAWPARGRLLSSFGTKTDGLVNDGVNIALDVGTEVRSADDGVVAYAGDALKGFGNLLLVKHADNWITAYANNSTLKVAKGDKITRGQLIALSGQTGSATQPQLHFEVRQNGRAVDPLNYLSN